MSTRKRVSPKDRAISVLRRTDNGDADCVIVFRLRKCEGQDEAFQVIDSEYRHWTETESEPPEGMFESVGKWVRQRFLVAWGEDVGTRAVQVAVNRGLDFIMGKK